MELSIIKKGPQVTQPPNIIIYQPGVKYFTQDRLYFEAEIRCQLERGDKGFSIPPCYLCGKPYSCLYIT